MGLGLRPSNAEGRQETSVCGLGSAFPKGRDGER